MIGAVLAAGAGRRLLPLTEGLPKTLLPVDGENTILDRALANLAAAALTDVVVVAGYRSEALTDRAGTLEERHGVRLEIIDNTRAEEWNNAYSLWLARQHLSRGMVLVNGDTLFPDSVIPALLAHAEARRECDMLLAVDDVKQLGDEEMKVKLDGDGIVHHINKAIEPGIAAGEYIGVSLIRAASAHSLAEALEATWQRDPGLYYEDGYQEFIDRGGRVGAVPIGEVEWVEVDDHRDLERAREIACRS